ncbi:ABC transporter permease, partial [Bacillus sp. EKM417B]
EKPETMTKIFWEKFSKNKLAVAGAVILFVIIMSAIFAPVIAPYSQEQQNLLDKFIAPGLEHLMGTDKFGRDIFSRILYGARISLLVGFASVVGSIFIGTILGAVAGYFKGFADAVIMRLVDIVLSIPDIFLLITLVTIF